MDENIKHRGNAKELTEFIPVLHGKKGYHSTWSTPEAFTNHIKHLERSKAWTDAGWEHGSDWSGTKDMESAIKLAEDGWKEGIEQVERVRNRTAYKHPVQNRTVRYDLAGTVPNVPRAIAGNVFNMKAPEATKSRRRPVITLVSNMAANCGVSAETISNRSAVVAAIIDQIETAGFACEVIATATTKGSSWGGEKNFASAVSVVVKKSDQYADVKRLAFSLGHTAMFRRMVFADWGTDEANKGGLGRSLGSNLEIVPDEDMNFKNIYSLPSPERMEKLFRTEEVASTDGFDFLIKSLKAQKCPAFPPFTEQEQIDWDKDKAMKPRFDWDF